MKLEELNVLLVDDNVHMRNLVKTILRALGVPAVKQCIDGADGLRELGVFSADIVVVDWIMQPMDGIEFVRAVRQGKNHLNPYMPIIMMTGHAYPEAVTEARDAGVNGFVVKPLSARPLYDRFLDVLERPRPFVRTADYFGPDRRRRDLYVRNNQRLKDVLAPA